MGLWRVATCHGAFVVVVKCLHKNEPYINVTIYVFVQYFINMNYHAGCELNATTSSLNLNRYFEELICVNNLIDTTNGVMVILL